METTHVYYGDIHSVSLNNIHKIICSGVRLSNHYICVRYSVFAQDRLDFVVIDIRERYGVRDGYPTLVFLPDSNSWRFLVQPDPEAFKFRFDNFLVAEGFEYVQDNEDEITRPSN